MSQFESQTRPALAALAGVGVARRVPSLVAASVSVREVKPQASTAPAADAPSSDASSELKSAAQQLQGRQPGASRRANNIQFAGQTPSSQASSGSSAAGRSAAAAKANAEKLAQFRANKDAERDGGGMQIDPAVQKPDQGMQR